MSDLVTAWIFYLAILAVLGGAGVLWWRLLRRPYRLFVIAVIGTYSILLAPGPAFGRYTPRYIVACILDLPILMDRSQGRYADGYSHSRFLKVHVGMTREEVEKLVGKPIYGGECSMYAVENGTDAYYVHAFVRYDRQGIVTTKIWRAAAD